MENDTLMTRRSLIALGLSATLVACAPLGAPNPLPRDLRRSLRLADITVITEGASFQNTRAADRASTLGSDLRQYLSREFSERLAPEGMTLQAEVSRLNVASGSATAFGRDQSRLQGTVRIIDTDGALLASYPVLAVAGSPRETRGGALAGAAVNSAGGYYRDLLDRFARDTREAVLGAYLPGERTARQVGRIVSE